MSLLSTGELLRRLHAYGVTFRKDDASKTGVVRVATAEALQSLPPDLASALQERREEIRSYVLHPPAHQAGLNFEG